MRHLFITMAATSFLTIYAMEDQRFSHNTYQGRIITPESLLELAPKIPAELEKQTDQWMAEYQGMVNELVATPHPLTHEGRKQKSQDNLSLIKRYEQQGDLVNLSTFNYVLRFLKYNNFTVPINRWGSRIAYWIYASGQGSVLDPNFQQNFDCSKFERMPSYQHCSRLAHWFRLDEIIKRKGFQYLKTTPTYLKHIPGKPSELSDENYVVIQEWVPNLKELKQLPEEGQRIVRNNIHPDALREIHAAIVYAALWGLRDNLAVNGNGSEYYAVDLEEPFNHKPQFFFFQGEEGKRKYVMDVKDGLERMAQKLQESPNQFAQWKQLTADDQDFKKLCEQQNIFPNYDHEYLNKRD